MSASMAITAFPILARILKERAMTHTPLGQLSLASAAIADVLAWIVLALVVGLIQAATGWAAFARMLVGGALLAAFGFGLMRPLLARVLARHAPDGKPEGSLLGFLGYTMVLVQTHGTLSLFGLNIKISALAHHHWYTWLAALAVGLAIGTLIVIFAVLASLLRQCGGSFDAFCAAKGVFRL